MRRHRAPYDGHQKRVMTLLAFFYRLAFVTTVLAAGAILRDLQQKRESRRATADSLRSYPYLVSKTPSRVARTYVGTSTARVPRRQFTNTCASFSLSKLPPYRDNSRDHGAPEMTNARCLCILFSPPLSLSLFLFLRLTKYKIQSNPYIMHVSTQRRP